MAIASLSRRRALIQDEAEVPWWAMGALDLSDEMYHVRRDAEFGISRWQGSEEEARWLVLKQMALKLAGKGTALEFAKAEPAMARDIAKRSPRAFMQLCDIKDDDGEGVVLAPFHMAALKYIRGSSLSVVLLPFMHGKSWLANIAVPLLDWAVEKEATQIRIYDSQDHVKLWTRKLMDEVDHNQALQFLFPWIHRPEPGEPCEDIWSLDGFAIGGKQVVDPSFRGLTIRAGRVGLRGDRVILDDLVTEVNAASRAEMDKYERYLRSSAMTMRRFRQTWNTKYCKWGTLSLIGTIFDKRDVNSRLYRDWQERIEKGDKERRVLRIAVYPGKGSRQRREVIWPSKRPVEFVEEQERQLGTRAFRQRMMNMPFDNDEIVFREELVNKAFRDDLKYGQGQQFVRTMIGYDPGVGGERTKHKKFPAAVVMQFPEEGPIHVVEWGRWSVAQPQQVRRLVEWSHRYDCPVVVESNNLQRSYGEWIAEVDPGVKVINHHTGGVKHDKADGVESFQPLFENEGIVFHCDGASQNLINDFKEEWVDWPQGRYSDLMMACWIAKYQYRRLKFAESFNNQRTNVPAYVTRRGLHQVIDLRPYR